MWPSCLSSSNVSTIICSVITSYSIHYTKLYDLWQYKEAGTYLGYVDLKKNDAGQWNVTIPKNAKSGDTIHIIAESKDDGSPVMTRYQRIIVTVK